MFNASNSDFEIPDDALACLPRLTLAGHPTAPTLRTSTKTRTSSNYYAVLSYQKTKMIFRFRLSAYTQWGQIHFVPDPVNDLIFTGVASQVRNTFFTNGVQFDLSDVVLTSITRCERG